MFYIFISSGGAVKRGVEICHATLQFGGKCETKYLNTKFPLSTLLCAGYSVKHFFIY